MMRWIVLLVMGLGICSSGKTVTTTGQKTLVDPPVVSLENYGLEDDGSTLGEGNSTEITDFIVNEGNEYFVTSENIIRIVLTCTAAYPIYWEIVNVRPSLLNGILTNTRVQLEENGTDWESVEFQSYLVLENHNSITGGYKCRSVENEGLMMSTDVHVFLPGAESKDLANSGQTITVGLNGADTVTLPCKTTRKGAAVKLLIKDDETEWLTPPFEPTFDPKQGFTLYKNETTRAHLNGTFKCLVSDTEEEMIVQVQQDYKEPSFPIHDLKNGTAIWRRTFKGDGVECCSDEGEPPALYLRTCESKPECDIVGYAFTQIQNMSTETGGLLDTMTSFSFTRCSQTMNWNVLASPFFMKCSGRGIHVSQEFKTDFALPTLRLMRYVPKYFPYSPERSIKLKIKVKRQVQSVFEDEWIDVDPKSGLCHGGRYAFDCCALPYHHAIGRVQRIVWKNGTISSIPGPSKYDSWSLTEKDFCFTYSLFDDYENDADNITLTTADKDMSHFECIVPRWDNPNPIIRRMKLYVRELAAPVLDPESRKNLTIIYTENQIGLLQLECTLTAGSGVPIPKMSWKKDGKNVNQTDKYWSMMHKLDPDHLATALLFMRALKEIEGEYECTLANSEGTVSRYFSVKVQQRSYLDYWIALILFGSLFVCIVLCGFMVTSKEKHTVAFVKGKPK